MELRNRRTLVLLLALCALFIGASVAQAQVTYSITTTPTFVINTGRAEVLGAARITPINAATTVASTIDFLFEGTPCDNDTTTGIFLNFGGVYGAGLVATPSPTTGAIVRIVAVTNTGSGCVVSVTVPQGFTTSGTSADFIELAGVRGRVDMSLASTPGVDINVRLNATPSSATLFTTPSTARVATSQDGLIVSVSAGSVLVCGGAAPVFQAGSLARIEVREGFNGAFVQHVVSLAGTPVPANARPVSGATNNTQIHLSIGPMPAGVSLTWPTTVTGVSVSGANVGAAVGVLQRISVTATDVVYEYTTADQGVSDLNTERFRIEPAVAFTQPVSLGNVTGAAQLYPPLITGDATSLTTNPFGGTITVSGTAVTVWRPRFNDPLDPSPARNILQINPCVTNLLFPYVANVANFDTGMAIANTSLDPFNSLFTTTATIPFRTVAQSGTCTLSGWQADTAASVSFTTGNIAAGTTYRTLLSAAENPVFNGFVGYIIARCNFQYAHGFAFIVDGYGLSAPRVAEGYVALIIPDPVVTGGRLARHAAAVANEGEGLGN